MKYFILFFLLFFPFSFLKADENNQHSTYLEAIKEVKQDEKRGGLFIFTADWCQPCKKLKRETVYPLLPKLHKYTIVYFVNIDKEKWVSNEYKKAGILLGVPTYALTSLDGKSIIRYSSGYKNKEEFVSWYNGE